MGNATAATSAAVIMEQERETKNTVRFTEVNPPDPEKPITFYVPKITLDAIGNPNRIEVTITPA